MTTRPTATISKLVFSGGQEFNFGPTEKILLIGPNNSGKSQSLREIATIAARGSGHRSVVVKGLDLAKTGTANELQNFLEEEAEYSEEVYHYKDWSLHSSHVRRWKQPCLTGGLAPGFIKNIEAIERLQICEQQPSVSPDEQKTKPQHILYYDPELMKKVSGLFRRAFAEDLMFNFLGGSVMPIHVGKLPGRGAGADRVGTKYVKAVRRNPLLNEQGDGMKCYAGILFEAVVSNRDITLIDEPEAFLHPPQMRRLGETLCGEVSGQLLVATHSSDIMKGFLDGTKGNLRILRIRRIANQNVVNEATPEVIEELWKNPEMRYSSALEGVFHEQVLLCEHDSDCRLLNSVADYLANVWQEQWQDTAYVPTGGKHNVPRIANVLRQIGVPVRTVCDIDFLSERELVRKTVEAFGGSWEDFEPDWERVDAAVRDGIQPKTVSQIKTAIVSLLEESGPDVLPKGDIEGEMKLGKAWSQVKRHGESAIPRGDAQSDYRRLREKLEGLGIFLIPVGEIENFCPEIGGHGPKFVTRLLLNKDLGDGDLEDLCSFVNKVHSLELQT